MAVNHDSLGLQTGSARVTTVHLDPDGLVEALTLDSEVDLYDRPGFDTITDLGAVDDVSLIGAASAVLIRRDDGALTTHPVAGDGESEVLAFTPLLISIET